MIFKITTVLLEKGKGLLWKKKRWTITRRTNALKKRKDMLQVEEHIRKPYTAEGTIKQDPLSENKFWAAINGYKRSYADIVDDHFKNLKNS